jgi:hypothetical protein
LEAWYSSLDQPRPRPAIALPCDRTSSVAAADFGSVIQNLTGPEMNCYIDIIPTGTPDHDVIKVFKTYANIPAIILT